MPSPYTAFPLVVSFIVSSCAPEKGDRLPAQREQVPYYSEREKGSRCLGSHRKRFVSLMPVVSRLSARSVTRETPESYWERQGVTDGSVEDLGSEGSRKIPWTTPMGEEKGDVVSGSRGQKPLGESQLSVRRPEILSRKAASISCDHDQEERKDSDKSTRKDGRDTRNTGTGMPRSLKKGPYVCPELFFKIRDMDASKEKYVLKTWSRSTTILPVMIGHTLAVHNGRQHIPVFISEQMVGHKLGEFASTRTFTSHVKKDRRAKRRR